MSNFSEITFNPDTDTLTIKDATTAVVHSFDLSSTAVKLKVTRDNGQLSVEAETGSLSNFGSDRLELRIKYTGTTTTTTTLFGDLEADIEAKRKGDTTNYKLGKKDKFHALFIGSDDIRHNRTGSQVLTMEDDVVSFGIDSANNLLVVAYHDYINPNV